MRSRVALALGSLLLLFALAAFRELLPFRSRSSTEGPIPGPPEAPVREHLPSVQVEKPSRWGFLQAIDPALTVGASQNSVLVAFTPSATVGQANAAINAAGGRIISVIKGAGILTVQFPGSFTFSGLDEARAVLMSHRCVETVALNFVMFDDYQPGLPMGILSSPRKELCAWAALQVMKAYGITSPLHCSSRRVEINGRELFISTVVPAPKSLLFAIVEDEAVYPFRMTSPSATAPGNVLGLTDEELSTQRSPKLTGLTHWSQRTLMGQYMTAVTVYDSERVGPEPVGPLLDLDKRYSTQLAHLKQHSRGCIDEYLDKQPEFQGMTANLHWRVHPDGHVSDILLKRNGDRVPDTEFWDLERCFAAELRQLPFPSHGSEDIFPVTESYRLMRKIR